MLWNLKVTVVIVFIGLLERPQKAWGKRLEDI